MVKKISSVLLVSLPYFILFFLNEVLLGYSPESVEIIKRIPMFMGAVSAFYYLFEARCLFSKLMTLYSFLLSSCYLFVVNHVHALEIAIYVVVCVCCCFLISYYFISEKISMDNNLDLCFLTLLTSRFFMSPEIVTWEIALVLELIFLFVFNFRENPEYFQHRKGVFFSLTLLFLLSCFYTYTSGVPHDMNIVVVAVLAAAGAGGVQFMCFSKTERGQNLALLVYIINNVILGFIFRKEGEIFPQVTIWFLIGILCLYIYLWLTSQIKNESIYSVLSESKNLLRGIIFPALCLLNHLFLDNSDVDLNLWIASFIIQIIVFHLLKFILKNEDEYPDREGDQGEGNKGDKRHNC